MSLSYQLSQKKNITYQDLKEKSLKDEYINIQRHMFFIARHGSYMEEFDWKRMNLTNVCPDTHEVLPITYTHYKHRVSSKCNDRKSVEKIVQLLRQNFVDYNICVSCYGENITIISIDWSNKQN
jgi:hypothetical protein